MPIEPLIDIPAVEGLPQAGYAALVRLLVWYWRNECSIALPERSIDRLAIARAHQATWSQHEQEIMRIFVLIRTEFDRAWANRDYRRDSLSKLREKAIATNRAKRLLQVSSHTHVSNHAPQRRADIRQAAAEARAVTAKEKGFSD